MGMASEKLLKRVIYRNTFLSVSLSDPYSKKT